MSRMLRRVVGSGLLVLAAAWAGAGESAGRVLALVDQRHASMSDLAMRIWELAEVGYQERKSSRLLQDRLESAGFSVEVLGRLLETNLRRVGGFVYSDEEIAFSKTIQATLASPRPIGAQENVEPWNPRAGSGSTDVADISWVVPTAEFVAATWVPGTPAHSWQAVAAGGTSIGLKGMEVATKTLALTALELFEHPELLEKARQELLEGQGVEFQYEPLVGDRQPPLDYRN